MTEGKRGFIDVDTLQRELSSQGNVVERIARFYGRELPALHQTTNETRMACAFACDKQEATGDRSIAVKTQADGAVFRCFYYGCTVRGNLLSLPEKRFRLYTLIHENPKLICAPDAAFLLSMAGHKKIYYLEQDRHSSGVYQVASSKTKGYAVMAEAFLQRRHFPQATVEGFTVILVAPSPKRRDALRTAIKDKPGSPLWRFASATDLTPESFLFEPIFYPCDGQAVPLVRRRPTDAP